ERRAIKRNLSDLTLLLTDAVRCDERHDVRGCMTLHHAPPMIEAVDRRRRRWFAPDRGRIEQNFRADQGHGARAFGEPLVPTDADAEGAEARLPDLEAGVAGREVELLLITRTVGNV